MKKAVVFMLSLLLAVSGCTRTTDTEDKAYTPEPAPTDEPEKYITVSLAGDCTLASDHGDTSSASFMSVYEREDDYSYFFKNCLDYFDDDDLTLVNLECALSSGGSLVEKEFNFRGKPEFTNILTEGSIEAVTLANNHSRDYGTEAFEDTQKHLDDAGIKWCSGSDVSYFEANGLKVGLVGIYALTSEGAALLEEAMEKVHEGEPDIIIVSFHWGIEKATSPTEQQITLAHKAVDLGANLVAGHHPHVLQGIEKYDGAYICYSLGNFCFGGNYNPSDKDTMIFRQTFTVKDGKLLDDNAVEIIPFCISSTGDINNYQPSPAGAERRERIIKKITQYSQDLGLDLEEYYFGD